MLALLNVHGGFDRRRIDSKLDIYVYVTLFWIVEPIWSTWTNTIPSHRVLPAFSWYPVLQKHWALPSTSSLHPPLTVGHVLPVHAAGGVS